MSELKKQPWDIALQDLQRAFPKAKIDYGKNDWYRMRKAVIFQIAG
jgi:hypothetical protein